MSCDYYDDGPEAHRETRRRARKDHRCDACRETIRRGDLYLYISGIWDGDPASWRYCLRCAAISDAILAAGEMPQMGLDCGHEWTEVFGAEPPPGVARLAFLTRDEMQAELARKVE